MGPCNDERDCKQRCLPAGGCLPALATLLFLSLASSPAQAGEYAQAPGSPMGLGQGFDSGTGERRQKCVDVAAADEPPAQLNKLELEHIESAREMQRTLRVAASARFKTGIWSFSGSVDYLDSASYSSKVVYFVVRVYVENTGKASEAGTLNATGKAVAGDVAKFKDTCGDAWVSSTVTGGEFIAVLRYEAETELEARDFKSSISASMHTIGASGGIDVAVQETLKQFQSSTKLKIEVLRKGPVEALPNPTIKDLTDYALKFPSAVAPGKAPYPIAFRTSSYREVGVPESRMDEDDALLQDIADARDAVAALHRASQAVLKKPADYSFFERDDELARLKTQGATLDAIQKRLKDLALACMERASGCESSKLEFAPESIYLPRLIRDAGGCTQWKDGLCARCEYTARQAGVAYVWDRSAPLICPKMVKGKLVLKLQGTVSCGDKNEYGNTCGDSNGGVDWWGDFYVQVAHGLSEADASTSSPSLNRNVRSNSNTISIQHEFDSKEEPVVLRFYVAIMQMWPSKRIRVLLDDAFKFEVAASK